MLWKVILDNFRSQILMGLGRPIIHFCTLSALL